MKLQMHSIHFDADPKLISFVEKKTGKLDRLYDRIIDGEIFLKIDKKATKENKIVEIILNIPGSQLFARDQSDTFEGATDEAVQALKRQLQKFKEKKTAH